MSSNSICGGQKNAMERNVFNESHFFFFLKGCSKYSCTRRAIIMRGQQWGLCQRDWAEHNLNILLAPLASRGERPQPNKVIFSFHCLWTVWSGRCYFNISLFTRPFYPKPHTHTHTRHSGSIELRLCVTLMGKCQLALWEKRMVYKDYVTY